ncbi:hypothetical protein NFJ02_18g30780 [Pycnococcus provasolii]
MYDVRCTVYWLGAGLQEFTSPLTICTGSSSVAMRDARCASRGGLLTLTAFLGAFTGTATPSSASVTPSGQAQLSAATQQGYRSTG